MRFRQETSKAEEKPTELNHGDLAKFRFSSRTPLLGGLAMEGTLGNES